MKNHNFLTCLAIAFSLLVTPNAIGQTPGQFEIRYDTSALTALELSALQAPLDAAANFWESIIPGYRPGVFLDGIDIFVSTSSAGPLFGSPGGVIAEAGPGNPGGFANIQGAPDQFLFATSGGTLLDSQIGQVIVDQADLSTSLIFDVLRHEIAHTLGFGLLFDDNNLLDANGQYIGQEGLAAYQSEFDPLATFVPLSPDGAHLSEFNNLTDSSGNVAGTELLTPIIAGPTFLSNTSIGILRDLGFDTTVPVTAVPEPSAVVMFALGGMALCGRRRKVA